MSYLYYQMNPPQSLKTKCGGCSDPASFHFARSLAITKAHITQFSKIKDVEIHRTQDFGGQFKVHAVFFLGLSPRISTLAGSVPEEYEHAVFTNFMSLNQSLHKKGLGTTACKNCVFTCKHHLNWPEEAYYSVEHKGKQLWAFHREHMNDIRAFIASEDREPSRYSSDSYLRRIPSSFLSAKVRASIVKKINKILATT